MTVGKRTAFRRDTYFGSFFKKKKSFRSNWELCPWHGESKADSITNFAEPNALRKGRGE